MILPNHIQYIIDNHSTQLQAKLKSEVRNITTEQAIDTFLVCDPSQGKKLTDWLAKTYISGGFRWEDVEIGAESKLAEVLSLYQQYFNQIPRDQRNVYDYKSYGELYTLVRPYLAAEKVEDILGSREIKRRERAQALNESEVLYRSEAMIIAVPLTKNAAKWWGRGTKWCTAAEKNNYFDHYNKTGPLIVITLMNQISDSSKNQKRMNNYSSENESSVEKFQLWTDGNDIQFMDAQDSKVDNALIRKHWNSFGPLLNYLIKENWKIIDQIPKEYLTQELCKQAIQQNGLSLFYIPRYLQTSEFYRLAVEQNGTALCFIPNQSRTPELCRIAVKQAGKALAHVPLEHRTVELYHLAVEQNGEALAFIPNDCKTLEICRLAVKQKGSVIVQIPKEFVTAELCMLAAQQKDYILHFIPEEFKTFQLCWQATKQNGGSLACVPRQYRTPELCRMAVENDGMSLCDVPEEFVTAELCRLAVEQNAAALSHIPYKLQTTDMYRTAVKKDGCAIFYVPDNHITVEIFSLAIDQTSSAIKHISERVITYELAKIAVKKQVDINYIPEKYRLPELIELANAHRIKAKPVWNHCLLAGLQGKLSEHFKELSNEIAQPHPIHH